MPSSISFYGGWAGLVIVGAGYWYLQKRRNTNRPTRLASQKTGSKSLDIRKDSKPKKQRNEGGQSSGDQGNTSQDQSQKKRKRQNVAKPEVEAIPAPSPPAVQDEPDDDVDNREFARQLQSAKTGQLQPPRPQTSGRQKSIKQSRARDELKPAHSPDGIDSSSNNISAPSSTAGVDADDDLSAANSPEIGATKASGDISDMLEAPAPGTSVLRITEPTSPRPQATKKPAPAAQVVETKKQRQNRKKAEAKKLAKEEDEKERRVLLEKQRRTAREAEGRAAKDGSAFMAANAPKTSAWTAPVASSQNGNTSTSVNLLDTFDPVAQPAAVKSNAVSSTSAAGTGDWHASLPSEEEQIRLIEEETAWNTVTSKKGKKNVKENIPVTQNDSPFVSVSTINTRTTDPAMITNRAHVASEAISPSANALTESTDAPKFKEPMVSNMDLLVDGKLEKGVEFSDDEWEV